jgi:hypothetical protein
VPKVFLLRGPSAKKQAPNKRQRDLGRPQNGARRGRGDKDHQERDDRGRARLIHPQQRGRAASYVQPAQDNGEPSAQPREHQAG